MKRTRVQSGPAWVLLGLVLAAAAAAASDSVSVDYDKQADFTRYKTWSWGKGTPAPNPISDKRLRQAVETRLTARGLQRVEEKGDLEVVYHAASDSQIGLETLGYKEPDFQTEATRVTYVRVGTVLMDIIDASSGKVVWRGQAQGVANPAYKDIERKIDGAVEKLFEKFPLPKR